MASKWILSSCHAGTAAAAFGLYNEPIWASFQPYAHSRVSTAPPKMVTSRPFPMTGSECQRLWWFSARLPVHSAVIPRVTKSKLPNGRCDRRYHAKQRIFPSLKQTAASDPAVLLYSLAARYSGHPNSRLSAHSSFESRLEHEMCRTHEEEDFANSRAINLVTTGSFRAMEMTSSVGKNILNPITVWLS